MNNKWIETKSTVKSEGKGIGKEIIQGLFSLLPMVIFAIGKILISMFKDIKSR